MHDDGRFEWDEVKAAMQCDQTWCLRLKKQLKSLTTTKSGNF